MNERHLEKIRKCLELSKSSNPNEAANALKLAQSLMRKYGMTETDIEMIEVGKTTANESVQVKPVLYANALINIICRAFGVDVILSREGAGFRPQFIGSRDRAEIAAYSFDVVYRLVKKARTEYIKERTDKRFKRASKTAIGDSFAIGYVNAIAAKLPAQELSDDERIIISKYIAREYRSLDTAEVRERESKREWEHRLAGDEEGRKAEIAMGVNGSANDPLLLR